MKRFLLDKRVIVVSAFGLALIGGGAYAYHAIQPVETPIADFQPKAKIEKKVATEVTPETEQIQATPSPTTQEPPKQAVVQPVTPTPVAYKWATEMTAAGIAESDFGYVTDMVLEDYGWRTNYMKDGEVHGIILNGNVSSNPHLWQNAWSTYQAHKDDLVTCIMAADHWVKQSYGSWAKANELWVRAGNF